jgi:hypothetical protein
MNNIVPLRAGQAPAIFSSRNLPDMNAAAQQGLPPAFSIIGYKGRNWRIKHRGDEELIKDPRTGAPVASLDVVIIGISPNISKQFYEKKYAEGDDASPDCYSVNGIAPEPDSPKLQCQTCAACPQNVYGSRLTENGKKAKACQDSRRLAVVPSGDIENESFGGPMLLRLPPMSLSSLAKYGNELTRFAAQPYMVETILSFDYDVAYPLLTFKAAGWLTDEQARAVAEQLDNPLVDRILNSGAVEAATQSQENTSALSGGRPAQAFEKPADAGVVAPPPATAQPQPTAAPVAPFVAPVAEPEVEDEDARAVREAEAAVLAAKARAAAKAAAAAAKPATTEVQQPAATATTAAAPAPKPSPFAAKRQAAAAAPAVAQAASAPGEEDRVTAPTVQQAPPDLEEAIDALLS